MQYDGQSDQGNKGIHPNPERMSPSSRKAVLTSPAKLCLATIAKLGPGDIAPKIQIVNSDNHTVSVMQAPKTKD